MKPFPKCKDCAKILSSHKSVRCNHCNNLGRKFSEETRRKMSITNSNKPSIHKPDCICSFCKAKRGELIGYRNPRWLGGKRSEVYPAKFNKSLKRKISAMDENCCAICNKTEEENTRKLDIHHIDYNKQNCEDDNLLSLCRSCHVKTNFNREYWKVRCTEISQFLKWLGVRYV